MKRSCAIWLAFWSTSLTHAQEPKSPAKFRIAQYNVWELSRAKMDEKSPDGAGANAQLRKAAAVIAIAQPDILVINEIDFDEARENPKLFLRNYLEPAYRHRNLGSVPFDHIFFEPVNTGVPTGRDLNNDGKNNGPEDAYGFGKYPGQYGMAIYSRYPLEADKARTFQKFLWRDMPKNLMPDGSDGRPAYYAPEEVGDFRLSSKSHWDVPVKVGGREIRLLVSHPTPPVFDGPEDSNGRRNFDEVRLWADYIAGDETAAYIVDDRGGRGGLAADAPFVLIGDQNVDPVKSESPYGKPAIAQVLDLKRVQDPKPMSKGAAADNSDDPKKRYPGDAGLRTSNFGRIDYVLPSSDLTVIASAVFWPAADEPGRDLVIGQDRASDHHLVWLDLALPQSP